uniref:G_PROTEIN_RECEP_F1_2 domain-containing protein n=1 Tax=Ascaris lumbricoides TaxID=6252 RepID=A0A0M3HV61_ASCLU
MDKLNKRHVDLGRFSGLDRRRGTRKDDNWFREGEEKKALMDGFTGTEAQRLIALLSYQFRRRRFFVFKRFLLPFERSMSLFHTIDNIFNLTIGAVLVLSNMAVLAVITFYTNLRQKYSVLTIVLFNSLLTGVFSISNILFASILTEMGLMNDTTTNRRCLINPLVMLDIYLAQMNGISLLAISVERLIVLLFPLQYYVNWKKFAKCQIILWVTTGVSTSFIFGMLVLCAPERTVSIYCRPYELIPDEQSFPFYCLPCIFGVLSIGIMLLVIVLVHQGVNVSCSHCCADEKPDL